MKATKANAGPRQAWGELGWAVMAVGEFFFVFIANNLLLYVLHTEKNNENESGDVKNGPNEARHFVWARGEVFFRFLGFF